MRETMIERVALMVRDEIADIGPDGKWFLDEGLHDEKYFDELARAIIAAMRVPTEAMLRAASGSKPGSFSFHERELDWLTMIDAALTG